MRYANRRDLNHADIVADLERCGFSVQDTSRVGDDFPDLIVGRFGEDVKVEIKSEDGELSKGQEKFAREWRGRKPICVRSADEVIAHFNTLLACEG